MDALSVPGGGDDGGPVQSGELRARVAELGWYHTLEPPFPAVRYRADRDAAVVFWLPSARAWRGMIWTAGFDDVRRHARFKVRSTHGFSVRHVIHHASGSVIAGISPLG